LIALEVAASLTLLAGCGLMIPSVRRLLQVDFGLHAAPVLSAQLGLRQRSYPDPATRLAFYERLLPRLAAVPGVQAAGLANWWALQPPRPQPVEAEGSARLAAGVLAVSPDYFAALGVPLLQGRAFTAADRAGADAVALASETLARRLWPPGGAIGRQILVPGTPPLGRTVVGVVKDVRQSPTDEELADLYIPLLQAPGRFASLYLRTAGPPALWLPALRQAVQEVDPELALDTSRPLQEFVDEQLARPRFLASLLAGFALFAALLALLGVYGVIAYAVKQREHEIAVRMALGADARAVTRLFVRQGALVLGIGIAAGLCGATALGRSLETQLYGVRPGDPATLVAASLAFAAAGLAAVWWPARRAARTDPVVALREE